MTLAEKIYNCFKKRDCFSLTKTYKKNIVKPKKTIKTKIYDNLIIRFKRIAKRVYRTIEADEASCIILRKMAETYL